MKTRLLQALALVSAIALSPSSEASPQAGRNDRDRVCFYQDIHFQGWEDCYSPGDEVANLRSHRNSISSIRIVGRARVVVFDDDEFRGQAAEFSSDVADLGLRSLGGSRTWSDRIESLRIGSGFNAPLPGNRGNEGEGRRGGGPRSVREGVCVYEGPNFQGRSECWQSGEGARDLGRSDWSDRISSMRIFGRAVAVVYRDVNFRGEMLVVDRDISNLSVLQLRGSLNWSDQISSLEVDSNNRGNSRGHGRGRPRR